jgi:putative Mg2+ transporter-C (MgtC) family protein
LYQILLAALLGSVVGIEREYRNKSAGFRTVSLITVGSAIITILSIKIGSMTIATVSRPILCKALASSVWAIFKDENRVNGLTTAATIWATAAIGMCVGSGEYMLAVGGTALAYFLSSMQ